MRDERRNETMRFINLIDTLYEAKVKLYLATEVPLDNLAPPGQLNFPFQRSLSRLWKKCRAKNIGKKPIWRDEKRAAFAGSP